MIIKELFQCTNDGINLYLIKSDAGYFLKNTKTGIFMKEVIRPETDLLINDLLETKQIINKQQTTNEVVELPEIEDGNKELSEEEVATMLEEVF
jgi:hypothetical protein